MCGLLEFINDDIFIRNMYVKPTSFSTKTKTYTKAGFSLNSNTHKNKTIIIVIIIFGKIHYK